MIARDRRIADRRHQDDEVGGQGRPVRLLVAGHRRHARLPDRKRLAAEGVRRRDRQASCGRRRSARCRRRRWCSPTARSTSAPKAASSSSSGRWPTAREVLSDVELPVEQGRQRCGSRTGCPSRSSRGAAVSRGRIFFVSSDARLRDRPEDARRRRPASPSTSRSRTATARRRACRSSPTELVLKPGQTVKLHARLFDAKGRFLREEPAPRGRSRA